MSTPTVGVLALQGDVREHLRALEVAGAHGVQVRRPGDLEGLDGLVLPGGESTTIDKLTRAFDLRDPLRERIADGMPMFGSCAGMILLADRVLDGRPDQQTLGGLDVTVRRNAFGRQVRSFESDIDVAGVPGGQVRAVFIRAPWVEQLGPAVQVLARVPAAGEGIEEAALGRIVAVRQGPLLATSFHPEVTGDHRVHVLFVQIVEERA